MKTLLRKYPVMLMTGYFLAAWLFEMAGGADLVPPCLWKSMFNASCPGCGLNSAGELLMVLDLTGAWLANPLIYIVAPIVGYIVFKEVYNARFN
ncbi:MAG: DUF2752 domain-containing protein [Ignavibacteriaceae bacterium]|nr:DUF2752 domain-containing protein [Ignavibacteriaceae bacterium]